MNKPVYLGLSILEISKTLMYDFWYDYIKPKYQYKAKLWESVRNKMENVRKQRDIKLVTAERRRNYLVSEPSYHATKYFSENLLAIEMKKKKVKMNKPVYLGLYTRN